MRRLRIYLLMFISFALFAQPQNWNSSSSSSPWNFSGGLASIVTSSYQGTGGSRTMVVPYFSVRYGPIVFSPIEGLGVRIRSGDRWSYGGFLAAGFDKRRETDTIQPELRLNTQYNLGVWDLGFTMRQRLGNSENRGLSLDTEVRYTLIQTDSLTLKASGSISWMDKTYGQNIFNADSGIKSLDFNLNSFYRWSPEWSLITLVGLSELQGGARRSSLITKTNKVTAVVGVAYQF